MPLTSYPALICESISSLLESSGSDSVYRKWFLKALGVQGLPKLLAGFEDKGAQAVCTFAYSEGPGHEPIVFQGRTDVSAETAHHAETIDSLTFPQGKIVDARGPTDFGQYFVPN